MLDKVRKNVKSFGVQVVIVVVVAAFIGTIFLVWGHGGKSERAGMLLAKVYDIDITYPEYQHEYIQLVKQYRQMYKDQWSDEFAERLQLKRLAFDNILNQYILLHKAFEWGIEISKEEVMDYIRSLPVFQMNGKFSQDLYLQRLNMAQITPEKFEQDIRRHLIYNRIQERLSAGFKISDDELLEEFAKTHEKIKCDYIAFPPERFLSNIQISLDELKEYFEKNKDNYRQMERRSVEYLFVQPSDFQADANITNDEIVMYYNQHENSYVVPKQVKASHILLKADQNVTPEEDANIKAKTLGLLERVKAGEDFHELAKQYSQCPSAAQGGDLGFFGKGKMTPEFEKAAFSLGVGEVSQVIKSQFGYHIIKVEDMKPEHTRSLDEVKDEILRELRREKGKKLALEKAEDLLRSIYKGKLVRDFAFEDRITFREAGPFSKDEVVPGIGRNAEVMNIIFDQEQGKISRIVDTPKGYYIFKLLSIEPSHPATYEEVETRVELDARREKAKQKAEEEAEKVRERLLNTEDMASLAKEYNLTVSTTVEFGRGEYISGIGNMDDQQAQILFSLNINDISPVIDTSRGYIILKVKGKTGINQEEFAEQKDSIANRLLKQRQQELFTAWIERVKKDAKIEIYNEDFIDKDNT